MLKLMAACLSALLIAAGANAAITKAPFGNTADGKPVDLYTLANQSGFEAKISTYGATLVSLKTPGKHGAFANIVVGFDRVDPYVQGGSFYGATIGRYANRIALGKFTLDGTAYQVTVNSGPNTLHGGKGFDKRLWTAQSLEIKDGPAVTLTYVSADGEEGFPGKLTVLVTYTLRTDNSLAITYAATTTKPTVVNLTNHSYFNLSGTMGTTILNELLTLKADRFTPVDKTLIPTGEIRPVKGTPFDFTQPALIGARIEADDEQLKFVHGYDHNWVLKSSGKLATAAILEDPESGRVMEVKTTEPGIQFYSGSSRGGHTSLCLETQHFPDSPNHPAFPSTVLRPGQTYRSETMLVFRAVK